MKGSCGRMGRSHSSVREERLLLTSTVGRCFARKNSKFQPQLLFYFGSKILLPRVKHWKIECIINICVRSSLRSEKSKVSHKNWFSLILSQNCVGSYTTHSRHSLSCINLCSYSNVSLNKLSFFVSLFSFPSFFIPMSVRRYFTFFLLIIFAASRPTSRVEDDFLTLGIKSAVDYTLFLVFSPSLYLNLLYESQN